MYIEPSTYNAAATQGMEYVLDSVRRYGTYDYASIALVIEREVGALRPVPSDRNDPFWLAWRAGRLHGITLALAVLYGNQTLTGMLRSESRER